MRKVFKDNNHLFISLAEGNEQAFRELFFSYKDLVYSIALSYTSNHSDAEEIVQEVFSRLWKYREDLPQVNEITAWIRTVTRNQSFSALKKKAIELKRKKELAGYFPVQIENPGQAMIHEKELQVILNEAMDRLTPQQRKIFELSRLQGLDRNAIAEMLGLSATTVSNHLTIALRTVRSFLYEHRCIIIFCILLARLFSL